MQYRNALLPLALALVLGGSATQAACLGPGPVRGALLAPGGAADLPPARRPLVVPAGEPTLAEVLDELARVTGSGLVLSEPTRSVLAATYSGLAGQEVPAEEAYLFVETLLFHHHFVAACVKGGSVPLLAVYHLGSPDARRASGWMEVPEEQIDELAGHRALLVQTVLTTSHVDARQISTSLRGLMRDANYQAVIALGETSLLIRGTGTEVAEISAALVLVDRHSGELRARQEAAPSAGDAGQGE